METYDVKYSCGCLHEIVNDAGAHRPTGKQQNCDEHK